jgi:hypothetical protein
MLAAAPCPLAGCFAGRVLFELFRRKVAKRRVQPDAIVIALDELLDVSAQVFQIAILLA